MNTNTVTTENVLAALRKRGLPTNTTRVVSDLKDRYHNRVAFQIVDGELEEQADGTLDASGVTDMIKEMTGDMANPFADKPDENFIYLLYLSQNFVRKAINGEQDFSPDALVIKSQHDVPAFLKRLSDGDFGRYKDKEEEPKTVEAVRAKVEETGKFKKGNKLILAREIWTRCKGDKACIIEAFMTDLKMSKAGATTYFYNLKKGEGSWATTPIAKAA